MKLFKRIIYVLLGIIILGGAMGAYINTGIGSDPVSIFIEGGSVLTKLKPGTVSIFMYACFVLVTFFLDKKKIGIGTLIAMVGTKWPLDFVVEHFVAPQSFLACCAIDVVLCALFGIACALLVKSNLGASAYDGFTLSIAKTFKFKYTYLRYVCDALLLLSGWLMGGTIGVGTIIALICSGPFFNFFLKVFKCEK